MNWTKNCNIVKSTAMVYIRVSVVVLVLGVLLWFTYQYMVPSPLNRKDYYDEYDFIISE